MTSIDIPNENGIVGEGVNFNKAKQAEVEDRVKHFNIGTHHGTN